jgi:hypothetical protein
MKVFVWKGHGDYDVYAADTSQQLVKLFDDIVISLDSWGIDTDLEKSKLYVHGNINSPSHIRQAINYLVNDVVGIGTNELFEYGTGFETVKNY